MGKWLAGVLLFTAAAIIACGGDNNNSTENSCMPLPGVLIAAPGIIVQVRDAFGRAQALGTTAVVRRSDGSVVQSVVEDTLQIGTAFNITGTYSITLSRPYYKDATLGGVVVSPNGCLVNTVIVPMTLQLAPGAPALRSLYIIGATFLDRPGAQVALLVHFDAEPTVSTAVNWTVSDTTLATVDANGVVTAQCTKIGGTVKVTAASVVDGLINNTVTMGVAPVASCP
jgi:hypothetical protein